MRVVTITVVTTCTDLYYYDHVVELKKEIECGKLQREMSAPSGVSKTTATIEVIKK